MERNQNRFGRRGFTSTSPSSTSMANFGNSAMSRGTFMRGLGVAGAGVAAGMMGFGGVARAQETSCSSYVVPNGTGGFNVTPTGDANQDVTNVQCALEHATTGATILLKAAPTYFNFGDYGKVYLTKDVTIMGEAGTITLPGGKTATKSAIVGGGCGASGDFAGSITCDSAIGFTVKNIHFHNSHYASIVAHNSNGTIEITGCKGTDYIATEISVGWGPFLIGLFHGDNLPPEFGGPGGDLHGTVNIHHNDLEIKGGMMVGTMTFATATMVNDVSDLNFLLKFNSNTLTIEDGVGMYPASVRNVEMIGNTIAPLPNAGFGPLLGTYSTPHFKWITPGNVTITDNMITNPFLGGFEIDYAEGPVLIKNNQMLDGPCIWGGAILLWSSKNCTIANNVITGNLDFSGLLVACDPDLPSYNNTISGNDLSGSSAAAQVYISPYSHHISCTNNNYGPAAFTGLYIEGSNNKFTNENFLGNYPGWQLGPMGPYGGCIYLEYGSQYNQVTALKNGLALQGFAVCNQILDINYELDNQTTNSVPGLTKCNKKDPSFVQNMQAKAQELSKKLEQKRLAKWGSLTPPGRQ